MPSVTASGLAVDELGRVGPLAKADVKALFLKGEIDMVTHVWAQGMDAPVPFGAVRQLRWMVGKRQGVLHPFKAAATALDMLEQLARLQPAVDRQTNEVLSPLPRVHQKLAGRRCLPHVAQLVLTGEDRTFFRPAQLLLTDVGCLQSRKQKIGDHVSCFRWGKPQWLETAGQISGGEGLTVRRRTEWHSCKIRLPSPQTSLGCR